MKDYGVPIVLYQRKDGEVIEIKGELVSNINVMSELVEKYGSIEELLNNPNNMEVILFAGTKMWNEAAEIWNEEHSERRPILTEKQFGRMIDKTPAYSILKIQEISEKVQNALLTGLPQEQIQAIEEQADELGKNLKAAQRKKGQK
jgi:hypothetical protein